MHDLFLQNDVYYIMYMLIIITKLDGQSHKSWVLIYQINYIFHIWLPRSLYTIPVNRISLHFFKKSLAMILRGRLFFLEASLGLAGTGNFTSCKSHLFVFVCSIMHSNFYTHFFLFVCLNIPLTEYQTIVPLQSVNVL